MTEAQKQEAMFAALRNAETAMRRAGNEYAAHDLRIVREQLSFTAAGVLYDALMGETLC